MILGRFTLRQRGCGIDSSSVVETNHIIALIVDIYDDDDYFYNYDHHDDADDDHYHEHHEHSPPPALSPNCLLRTTDCYLLSTNY